MDNLLDAMRWETDKGQYAWGSNLILGKWVIAGSHNSSSRSKNDPKKWQASCKLPGIKSELGWYETEDEAQARAEQAVRHWFSNLSSTLSSVLNE